MARPTGARRPPGWALAVLALLAGGAAAVFGWLLVAQHRTYNSYAFDFGFFDQIIWNTAHGRWFETSFVPYNFAGQHMEPVLLLFAALYRVWPAPESMLLAQAFVGAGATLPLFLAVYWRVGSALAGLLVAAAYLLAVHLHRAMLFDFHPEVLAPAGVFAAVAALAARRPGWALVGVGSVFLLKEEAALVGVGMALIFWLQGYRRHALGLAAASLLYVVLVVGVVMGAIRGGPGDLQGRYAYLGTDRDAVVQTLTRRPWTLIEYGLGPDQRRALALLLSTQALLSLASPAALAAAPALAGHLLATHPWQHSLELHYGILPFTLSFTAAVLGLAAVAEGRRWARLWRWARVPAARRPVALAALLLTAQTIGWLTASDLSPRRFRLSDYQRTPHHAALDRAVALVPAEASVSAQTFILPHLSQRRVVWEFPKLNDADYVVIDRQGGRTEQVDGAGYRATLAALPTRGYCRLFAEDGAEVWRRGGC